MKALPTIGCLLELTSYNEKQLSESAKNWASVLSTLDVNGRSAFHYIATTSSPIPAEINYNLCSTLRSHPNILSIKDKFEKLALHYAVEAENLKQVKWYFQKGVELSLQDVDRLLSINVSRIMEKLILRELEALDIGNRFQSVNERNDSCDPSISTFALAKLQLILDDQAGYLHQLPLHRATESGNFRAVELLLEDGADPNVRDANLWTPLHIKILHLKNSQPFGLLTHINTLSR